MALLAMAMMILTRPAMAQQPAVDVTDTMRSPHLADTPNLDQRVKHLVKRIRPLKDRVVQDDRLRTASSIVGLGIAAYSVSRNRGRLPLGAVGAEALRLGLHRQLTAIQQKSGFTVEPSIGRRSFAITLHKTLD